MAFTKTNLRDVKDDAVDFGIGEVQEARFAREDLDAEQTGLAYHRVKPGRRQSFGHRHQEAEEVHVILSGSGRVLIDEETVEVKSLDALRISPTSARIFEADDEGLEYVVFGPHHEGDGEILSDFGSD